MGISILAMTLPADCYISQFRENAMKRKVVLSNKKESVGEVTVSESFLKDHIPLLFDPFQKSTECLLIPGLCLWSRGYSIEQKQRVFLPSWRLKPSGGTVLINTS